MLKHLDFLYLCFARVYTRYLVQDDPIFVAILGLSGSLTFIAWGALDAVSIWLFCLPLGKLKMIIIATVILAVILYLYLLKGRGRRIARGTSKSFSPRSDAIIFGLYMALTFLSLFGGVSLSRYFLSRC